MRRGRRMACGSGTARRPGRTGVLILDCTSFPSRAPPRSASRGRTAARGKVANCQTAATVALWTGYTGVDAGREVGSAGVVADALGGARARLSPTRDGSSRSRASPLTLLRQVRAAGFTVTAVVGDADSASTATLRRTLHRASLPYALGVPSHLKIFVGIPAARAPRRSPVRPTTCPAPTCRRNRAVEARAWAAAQTPRHGAWSRGATARTPLAGPPPRRSRHAGPRLAL